MVEKFFIYTSCRLSSTIYPKFKAITLVYVARFYTEIGLTPNHPFHLKSEWCGEEIQQQLMTYINNNFLVGNTRGDNVLIFDASTGETLGELITPGLGGLNEPDTLLFGPDANGDGRSDLYISSGAEPGIASILRFDGLSGEFIDIFVGDELDPNLDETGGLIRPYGMAFGPDGNLYVASFLSDQILRYDGTTGDFIDVFAQGNGQAGSLNGPNNLLFIDGSLYVTTQGSIATVNSETGEVFPDFSAGLASQILRYDSLETGVDPTVFATPAPSPDSFGFVSLLGLQLGKDDNLYVSDFANDIRRYDLETGELVDTLSTNYTTETSPSNNFIGSLAFAPNGDLLTVGFDVDTQEGAVLLYENQNGSPVNPLQVLVPTDSTLERPIGLTFFPEEPLEPILDPKINPPEENFSFQLLDYEIEHQGEAVIDLLVDLDLKEGIGADDPFEYPDFLPIRDFIDDFLVNYENETDFWEILNKNLVTTLLSEPIPTPFGIEYHLDQVLDSLTVDIDVQSGSSGIETPRSSTAVGTPQPEAIALAENFSFQLLDYEIEHQGEAVIDLLVDLDLKEGIGADDPFEYPDFLPIRDFIDDFLVNYENETDFWEILNKNLVTTLLSEPIPTPFGIEYNLDEVLDSLTVNIDVQSGSSGIETPRSSRVVQTVERFEPLPTVVFGSFEADSFDTEIPGEKQFIGNNQILFAGSGDDLVDITFAPGGELSRVDLGNGDDILFGGSNHRIIAGTGDDILFLGSGEGNNIITGGKGERDRFWLVTDPP